MGKLYLVPCQPFYLASDILAFPRFLIRYRSFGSWITCTLWTAWTAGHLLIRTATFLGRCVHSMSQTTTLLISISHNTSFSEVASALACLLQCESLKVAATHLGVGTISMKMKPRKETATATMPPHNHLLGRFWSQSAPACCTRASHGRSPGNQITCFSIAQSLTAGKPHSDFIPRSR